MRVLQISLGKHQTSQTKALQYISTDFVQIDWTDYQNDTVRLNRIILDAAKSLQPELTFMQLQREGLVTPATLQAIPGKKYNWTGDVRHPIPAWYESLAPYFDATLFSNEHDVNVFRSKGLRASFLNIGFEEPIYNINGESIKCGVVFMGNNYRNQFPLSEFRSDMVRNLTHDPSIDFSVYGSGWLNAENLNSNPQKEAAIYGGCEIAINLSHFDYDRYTSDRLFRIMACGAFCLSHHYKGIEKDFEVGVDLDTFSSIAELKEKIAYWKQRPDERRMIAQNGYKKVWENHTWASRIK